jgi:hypothetical protein
MTIYRQQDIKSHAGTDERIPILNATDSCLFVSLVLNPIWDLRSAWERTCSGMEDIFIANKWRSVNIQLEEQKLRERWRGVQNVVEICGFCERGTMNTTGYIRQSCPRQAKESTLNMDIPHGRAAIHETTESRAGHTLTQADNISNPCYMYERRP